MEDTRIRSGISTKDTKSYTKQERLHLQEMDTRLFRAGPATSLIDAIGYQYQIERSWKRDRGTNIDLQGIESPGSYIYTIVAYTRTTLRPQFVSGPYDTAHEAHDAFAALIQQYGQVDNEEKAQDEWTQPTLLQ